MALSRYGVAATCCLIFLVSCGLNEEATRTQEEIRASLSEVQQASAPAYSAVRVSPRPWLGLKPLGASRQNLPAVLTAQDAVTLPLNDIETDSTLAARIETITGLAVRLSGPGSDTRLSDVMAAALTDDMLPQGGIWTGPLDQLLDVWTTTAGYRWVAESDEIEIIRTETVLFAIHALQGTQSYDARSSTTENSGGEGSAGTANQQIRQSASFDIWKEISSQVRTMVPRNEGTVIVSPGTASVTVTASPRTIKRLRGWLHHLNRTALRPITVRVNVYTVRLDRTEDYQIGVAGVLERIAKGTSLELQIQGGGLALVSPNTTSRDTLNATIDALNSVGSASRLLSADIPSLNSQPAKFHELLKTAYLKEISVSTSETSTQVTLKPGQISSGFAMSYTALVTAPDEVLVQFTATLRDRPAFTEYGTTTTKIQLPVYGDRAVQAAQRLRRGQTLVVSGFRDQVARKDDSGTIFSWLPAPSGRRLASVASQEQILLLTAEIGAPLGITETKGTTL